MALDIVQPFVALCIDEVSSVIEEMLMQLEHTIGLDLISDLTECKVVKRALVQFERVVCNYKAFETDLKSDDS